MKRNKKGRFVKRASNPRKRRKHKRASNPRSSKKRRRGKHRGHVVKYRRRKRHAVVASNPRRRRRRHNPRARHHKRRRNPRFLSGIQGSVTNLLKEGALGGAGALVNSVLLGYTLPLLPASITTGYALDAIRVLSATGLAIAGKKFGGRMGEEAGKGAIAVAMYLLFRDILVSMAPTLPLGDYEEISIDSTSDQIGAYMDPAQRLGAYMNGFLPDGSKARQGTGAYMSGMGAYMSGNAGQQGQNYDGESDGFTLNGIDF